jgi:hypothetical protein
MCTVSFIPNARGFYLAMNRDELLTRPTALPPRIFKTGGCHVLCPREPTGGTWFTINDAGVCLALINWHRVDRLPVEEVISRGEVVRALAGSNSLKHIHAGLNGLKLERIRPFRLIVCVPAERRIAEYRWNLIELSVQSHAWQPYHWFSSGYDENRAESERAQVCQAAWHQPTAGSIEWLRDLHRSHLPEPGPFSICMHQARAETVSYTEVSVFGGVVTMRYQSGSPCAGGEICEKTLVLNRVPANAE